MSKSSLLRWPALAAALLVSAPSVAAAPRITEIQYHPPGTNVLAEWFELHNPGSAPLDLSHWRVTRGVSFEFPTNAILAPNAHLVIAADPTTFLALHPTITNVLGGWTGTLSDSGETLELQSPSGNESVAVDYATEGDWAARRLAAPDRYGKVGWEWFALHDGAGHTLELVNAALPATHGQNWASSIQPGGTPGQPNGAATNDAAPLILSPRHRPAQPSSAQPVTVSARILDEAPATVVALLHWRTQPSAPFTTTPLLDDGLHNDGLAADGLFAAILPAQTNGTLVEFHLTATDAAGHSRTLPAVLGSFTNRSPWFIYQVDDAVVTAQPVYHLVASPEERAYLEREVWSGSPLSDARINGTFIATDGLVSDEGSPQVRYLAGFRNRGHGTRFDSPHNIRVDLPNDNRWRKRTGINLNSQYTPLQNLGSAVFRALGVPIAESVRVQVRWNSQNLAGTNAPQWGGYAANEVIDGDLVARQVPQDPDGNLYQGVRDFNTTITPNLAWHGSDPAGYTNAYFKENHSLANDWSDLIRLIDVLNNTPPESYAASVRSALHVEQWMRYFAIHTFLDNQETTLGTGVGDDYVLYFPLIDRRAQVWAYDMDSLLGNGTRTVATTGGLFRAAGVPAISRFLKHPEFAPIYHQHLQALSDGFFDPARFDAFLDGWAIQLLGTPGLEPLLKNLKAYNASRVAFVRSQLPVALAVTQLPAASNGFPRSTSATTPLGGSADAARTASVTVNGSPATYSAWEGTWSHPSTPLNPGLNRILVQAFDTDGNEIDREQVTVWFDTGAGSGTVRAGTLASDETWSPANGPFLVTGSLTIPNGVTLRIQPGTTVHLAAGANLTVAPGGRLLAEGTPVAPLWIGRAPGTNAPWGGITLLGDATSPESRITHAYIEGNGSTAIHADTATVFLDHLQFGTTDRQYVSLDDSSFVVSHCHFPPTSAAIEPLHGTGGIKPGGHGLFLNNFIGSPRGYSDSIDFSGGNRPSQPILHIIGNVFAGSGDDALDLDGTDAWIEGNAFIGIHRNGAPDSSAAVSGGNGGGATSEITILNNLFFDTDNAATSKQGNFYTLLHNTIVRTTREGGVDFDSGIVNLRDTTPDITTYGRGTYLEGNIITDAENLIRNPLDSAPSTFINNLLPFAWTGPGDGNRVLDAQLTHIPRVDEARFNSWEEAQILWTWLSPRPGSPAIGAGIQGRNLGGVQPFGAIVSGEPVGTTASTDATLVVGPNRSGHGIPTDGFPAGSGYVAYRWRLDDGPWSAEIPIAAPIVLSNLPAGPHFVEVSGKRDSGLFQDDPLFGTAAVTSRSRTWIVDPAFVTPPSRLPLRIHEILAANTSTLTNANTTPDLVELHNAGDAPIDLTGVSLSDNAALPRKFTFPAGISMAPGAFLVLIADNLTNTPGLHLGFSLKASGDDLVLTDSAVRGSALLDHVTFGIQIPDRSIGRGFDGTWVLCQPTFGGANIPVSLGTPGLLRINEWLASARFSSRNDFVELFNPSSTPVALGGLHLSDATTFPDHFTFPSLSFIAGHGYARLIADGDPSQGADHLNFHLAPEHGLLRLGDPSGTLIDVITYGPQRTDVSQGRSPDAGNAVVAFTSPTPGGPNPGNNRLDCVTAVETRALIPWSASWSYQQTANLDGTGWQLPGYDDAAWPTGPGLLGVEECNCLPLPGLQTRLNIGRITYRFRTHFVVDTNLAGFNLNLATVVDDGAIIYLNGVIIAHPGMATNGVTDSTRAIRNQDNAALEYFPVPLSALVFGTNILAVEVHQTSSSSTDIVWGASLEASRSYTNCTPVLSSPVVLNEILARNTSITNATGQVSDWVELFNPSTNSVPLGDLSLTTDPAMPRQWILPPNLTLPPLGFLTIAFNPLLPPSPTSAPIALNASGGSLFLFDAPARGGSLIDSLHYGFQAADFALGRVPDGSPSWQLTLPSDTAANSPAPLGNPAAVRVNEWMADPAVGDDWFELFNTDIQPVAVGGLFLTDNLDSPFASPIPPLSFIGTGTAAYRMIFADGQTANGANHAAFNLRRAGEAIGLFAVTGQLLDGIAFNAQANGVSQGRFPDGAPTLRTFPGSATPGSANSLATTNDSDSDGLPDAWERAFGLDPANPADAASDPDNDGATNLREFLTGTHPRDADDVLALEVIITGEFALRFRTVAQRTYTVESIEDLATGAWSPLAEIPANPTAGTVTVPIATEATHRLYRVTTPPTSPARLPSASGNTPSTGASPRASSVP